MTQNYHWGNGSNPSGRIQQVRVNFCRRFTVLLPSPDLDLYWQHVVRNSDLNENTEKKYREEVAALEGQARKIYHTDDNFNVVPTGDQFVDIMVKQGCFILQVALCSLGGLAPLGYPEDGNLGKDWDKEMIDNWVSSMFSISKQFPLFILQKLMEQSFFQTVLSRGKWKGPHDLARMVLYDSLVKPTLDSHGRRAATSFLGLIHCKKSGLAKEEPTLLHALWLTLTGPDLSGGVVKEGDNVWSTVRSATELREAGIGFRNNKEMGIRGIKFKTKWLKFDAYLCLPFISIGPNTETLLKSLIDFEGELYQDGSGGEVCAYLKFMSELVRSHEDAKVLAVHGIIDADTESEEKMHHTLKSLHLPEVVNNQNLCVVRDEIRGYVKPSKWDKIVNLIVITLLLTLVQTIYTVVGYHHPKN